MEHEFESYKKLYQKEVVSPSEYKQLSYANIVQENQTVNVGKELFTINPVNADFFG